MDACICVNSVSEEGGHTSCVKSSFVEPKTSYVGPKEWSYSHVGVISLVDKDSNHYDSLTCKTDNSEVEELGIAFERDLQVQDVKDHLSGHDLNPDQNELCNLNGERMCQELGFHLLDNHKKITKILEKCVTFPLAEERKLTSLPVKGTEDIPSMPMKSQSYSNSENFCSVKSENSTCARSLSLPSSLKLVSAMKGGREQQGQPIKVKLNVKWALDVYDPPVTIMSHTVKNYQQRPKAKKNKGKDRHKHKNKGKLSRGSGTSEKKHANRSTASTADPLHLKLRSPADSRPLDGFSQSGVEEILDYAVGGKESKCGGSFLMGSLSKVQFPIAEAS